MSASNESAFRNSLNSIGWSRRTADPDLSTAQPSFLERINPFRQSGYIRLPTSQQDLPAQLPAPTARQENAAWFALSQWERIIVFACCVLGAAACFVMAFVLMPVMVMKPRKFVVLWTVGSILFLCRYTFLLCILIVVSLRYRDQFPTSNTCFRLPGSPLPRLTSDPWASHFTFPLGYAFVSHVADL